MLALKRWLLMWPLFFVICLSLGYSALQRYDPRTAAGMTDTYKYYAIVTGQNTTGFREIFRCRLLVPYVARPFYWVARAYSDTWKAGFFGLLMANALFCATTACLVFSIGNRLIGDAGTALAGATLYLLNFNISNLQLAGLIDSGEACFLAALIWSLVAGKWYLLPLWALLGALAKETFVPFSIVFAVTWWVTERRQNGLKPAERSWAELKWIVALAVVGLTTVTIVRSLIVTQLTLPWSIAAEARAPVNFFASLWRCVSERSFWYVFGWLIPLGIWRLRYFPTPWLAASVTTSILALLLGAYIDAGGTVGRPEFDITGALLSLSVAMFIARNREHTGKNSAVQELVK